MNKQKWTEKPITWGGYLKLCGVVCVISVIAGFVFHAAGTSITPRTDGSSGC